MRYTENHNILSSLREHLDYILIKDYDAVHNISDESLFKYQESDERIKTHDIYGSRFQQLSYFSELSGISSFEINEDGSAKATDDNGLKKDYQRGRALFDLGYDAGDIKYNASVKEFCSYLTSDPEEKIIFENKYEEIPKLKPKSYQNDPYGFMMPSIFLKLQQDENEKHCLSGKRKKKIMIRVITIASEYLLTGAADCFSNRADKCFPILDCEDLPLNEYGELKDESWNYSELSANSTKNAYIESVQYTPIQPVLFTKKNPNLYIGYSDFHITKLF